MAFSKRNSRPITIDGNRYRYCVSLGPQDGDHNFTLNITVQADSGEGSKLRVVGLETREFWVDFPDVVSDEQWADAYKIVKPRHISVFVKSAITNGWHPNVVGPPFELKSNGILPLGSDD